MRHIVPAAIFPTWVYLVLDDIIYIDVFLHGLNSPEIR